MTILDKCGHSLPVSKFPDDIDILPRRNRSIFRTRNGRIAEILFMSNGMKSKLHGHILCFEGNKQIGGFDAEWKIDGSYIAGLLGENDGYDLIEEYSLDNNE